MSHASVIPLDEAIETPVLLELIAMQPTSIAPGVAVVTPGSVPVVASIVVAVVCLVALVPIERRQRRPIIALTLFRIRQFTAINAATLLFYGALAAASYLVVLQCELQLGYSATAAGAALIPESVVFLLVSPLVGGLVARVGIRWPMAAGILLTAAAFAWLSAARVGESYAQAILPGAILWGLGIGVAVAPLTAGVLAAVEDTDLGAASAINDAASRVGGVVVVALVPTLLGAGDAHSLAAPLAAHYRTAMLVMAGLSVAAAVITAVYVTRSLPPTAGRVTVPSRAMRVFAECMSAWTGKGSSWFFSDSTAPALPPPPTGAPLYSPRSFHATP